MLDKAQLYIYTSPNMIEFGQTNEIKEWLGTGSVNFFSLPFGGKDSQADRFVERFGGKKFGGGAVLRMLELDPVVKEMMDQGELIPSEDFVRTVLPLLEDPELDGEPIALTAVGRFIGEETGVMEVLERTGHPLRAVVHLETDEPTTRERFRAHEAAKLAGLPEADRGHRIDDDERALDKRIHEYYTKTVPVIDVYRDMGVVIDVDATQPKDAVERDVLQKLAAHAARWF